MTRIFLTVSRGKIFRTVLCPFWLGIMVNIPPKEVAVNRIVNNGDNNPFPADLRAARGLFTGLAIGVWVWLLGIGAYALWVWAAWAVVLP